MEKILGKKINEMEFVINLFDDYPYILFRSGNKIIAKYLFGEGMFNLPNFKPKLETAFFEYKKRLYSLENATDITIPIWYWEWLKNSRGAMPSITMSLEEKIIKEGIDKKRIEFVSDSIINQS